MTKISIAILLFMFFLSGPCIPQSVEVFGYYEPQYLGVVLNNEYSQLFSNKLRVDLKSSGIDNVTFAANFDYINYQGRTVWNLLDYVPDDISDMVPSLFDTLFEYRYNDTVFLDNAFVKMAFSRFDLTLGRQQVSYGAGYAWNPTDLLNVKDIADPTYEQPGHNAARLDIAISSRYNALIIYMPESDWDKSGKLLKFNGKLSHFDYSLIYNEKLWPFRDYIEFEMAERKRRLFGGDCVGELFGLGVWSEFGFNTLENHDDFWEILFGLDYTFDNGAYLMAEFYHNELAKQDYRDFDLNDWLRYFAAESRTISKDNLFAYIDYPVTDLIHVGNSAIISVSDGSFSLVPSLKYSVFQNVEMNVFAGFNSGGEGKVFSSDQGASCTIRFTAYF